MPYRLPVKSRLNQGFYSMAAVDSRSRRLQHGEFIDDYRMAQCPYFTTRTQLGSLFP